MKKIIILLFVLIMLVSCSSSTVKREPKELSEKFVYSMGGMLYEYYAPYYQINKDNVDLFVKGILDKADGKFIFNENEMNQIMQDYTTQVTQKLKSENLEKAESFLKENATKDGVVSTSSGLQYKVLKEGSGNKPLPESTVNVYYWLSDLEGKEIQVVDEKNGPVSFSVNMLVPGVSEGLCLMNEGSKYRFWVHPSLGYGENGSGNIGPNQLLVFDFEIVSIVK